MKVLFAMIRELESRGRLDETLVQRLRDRGYEIKTAWYSDVGEDGYLDRGYRKSVFRRGSATDEPPEID